MTDPVHVDRRLYRRDSCLHNRLRERVDHEVLLWVQLHGTELALSDYHGYCMDLVAQLTWATVQTSLWTAVRQELQWPPKLPSGGPE